jgi:hypothetical protein
MTVFVLYQNQPLPNPVTLALALLLLAKLMVVMATANGMTIQSLSPIPATPAPVLAILALPARLLAVFPLVAPNVKATIVPPCNVLL